jgi:hypothetical protein
MVNGGFEYYLWRLEGIFCWEVDFDVKSTIFVRFIWR